MSPEINFPSINRKLYSNAKFVAFTEVTVKFTVFGYVSRLAWKIFIKV
jgi:hypothetical protein